jgi:hypothetical protein
MKDTDCTHYETADGDCLTNACGGCCVKYRAEVERLLAAESRAERLGEALREIERKTGHFGEAPPPPEWMPMLSLIAWVGRCARAALGEEDSHV